MENEQTCSEEPVEQGWINRFFDSVADVSNEDLQKLWGKVKTCGWSCGRSLCFRINSLISVIIAKLFGVTDRRVQQLAKEGIIPALESSHALAYALKLMKEYPNKPQKLIVNLSGRGDKDIFQVRERFEEDGVMPDGHLSGDSLALFRQKYLQTL